MDRRALRKLFERPSRPRPSARGRAGARQGWPVFGRAAQRHRQRRRLHLSADAGDHQRGEERHRCLPDAGDGSELQGRVHQHHADRRLSRRRPPRGQLLHGAADRHGGARDGHRPRRDAPAQPHRAWADALQGAVGHELRFGRVHHRARQGAGGRRLAGLRQAQGREQGPQQAARPRHRLLPRGHGTACQGVWRYPLRGRRHGHHVERNSPRC